MAETYPIGWKTLKEKEEFPRHEQFLLFPLCFQKTSTTDMFGKGLKKNVLKGENALKNSIFSLSHISIYSIKDRHHHFTYIKFVVCRCFKLRQMQNFVV